MVIGAEERLAPLFKRLEAVEASLRSQAYAGQLSANDQQSFEALFSRLAASEVATRSFVNPKIAKEAAAPAPSTATKPAVSMPAAVENLPTAEKTDPMPPLSPPPAVAAVAAVATEAPSIRRSKEGFLSEKGTNFFKPWQKRYFVVDDTSLTAYMSDKKDVKLSRVELKEVKIVEAKGKEITLHLTVGKKTLKGATPQEAADWAQAFGP